MKNIFYNFLTAILIITPLMVNPAEVCKPNQSLSHIGIYPSNLKAATAGEYYREVVTVNLEAHRLKNSNERIKLNVKGTLPKGLSFECNRANCIYPVTEIHACIKISGKLHENAEGNYSLFIHAESLSTSYTILEERAALVVSAEKAQNSNTQRHRFKVLPNQPNPFSRETEIRFILNSPQTVEFSIYDLLGNMVYQTKIRGVVGNNSYLFVLPDDFKSGSYFYSIKTKEGSITQRMMISRE
jgi:hypothetical protein